MEEYLKDHFDEPKVSSEEAALKRWRTAVFIVKNRRRRFRMVVDLDKRSEAQQKRNNIQEKISEALYVQKAALQFIEAAKGVEPEPFRQPGFVTELNEVDSPRCHGFLCEMIFGFILRYVQKPSVYSSHISPNGKFRKFSTKSWQKGAFLGSGSFGTVYEAYNDNGLVCAVKEVSLLDKGSQGQQSIIQLEQEISLLSQFEHENIVQYFGTAKDEAKLYIFLERVEKGSLLRLYRKYTLRDSQASSYTRQILNGMKYLHERNVVHRDIKCANILVDDSDSVKLADFGLAKTTISNDIKSCKGTAFWMAPEVVNSMENGYGLAVDIWSLGCTVLEMLTRQHPYSNLEWVQALFKIGQGEPPFVPNSLSPDARDFIHKCLQVNPSNRPTAAQLLEHSFVKR